MHAVLGLVFARASDKTMDLNLTAVFKNVPEGYSGFVEELRGANTQGATLEEAGVNLQEAIALGLSQPGIARRNNPRLTSATMQSQRSSRVWSGPRNNSSETARFRDADSTRQRAFEHD